LLNLIGSSSNNVETSDKQSLPTTISFQRWSRETAIAALEHPTLEMNRDLMELNE
jgi:hypothetical protein